MPRLESTLYHTTTLPLLATEAASCMIISYGPLLFPSPSFFSLLPSCPLPTPPSSVDSASGEEWSAWSVCSATCGEGWQSRTRFCVSSSYSTQCSGPLREQRPCNNSAVCPGKPHPPAPAPFPSTPIANFLRSPSPLLDPASPIHDPPDSPPQALSKPVSPHVDFHPHFCLQRTPTIIREIPRCS